MHVSVGTFNLNNLYSRFHFKATPEELKGGLTLRYEFSDPLAFRLRTYNGKLVKARKTLDTERIRDRILAMDVDVLAVQEVENLDTLEDFNRNQLGGLYSHISVLEGNDPRLIDLGVLSKLPLGAVTSHRSAVHPDAPGQPVFGRDLQEVEVLSPNRSVVLFTLYNNHLESHYQHHKNDPEAEALNDQRRRRQAETVARIVGARMGQGSRYIILGDMEDPPRSSALAPMVRAPGLGLVDALANPQETNPAKEEKGGPGPLTTAWTHRSKETGEPASFSLYDQIWVSPALANTVQEAWIDRRTLHGGNGSEHDPAWLKLAL